MAKPIKAVSVVCNTFQLPIFIDKYKKAGYDTSGNLLADDLHYGDGVNLNTGYSKYSIEEIEDLSLLFKIQLNLNDDELWSELNIMATKLFSIGELEIVAQKMINHFKSNNGTEFSDPILTKYN